MIEVLIASIIENSNIDEKVKRLLKALNYYKKSKRPGKTRTEEDAGFLTDSQKLLTNLRSLCELLGESLKGQEAKYFKSAIIRVLNFLLTNYGCNLGLEIPYILKFLMKYIYESNKLRLFQSGTDVKKRIKYTELKNQISKNFKAHDKMNHTEKNLKNEDRNPYIPSTPIITIEVLNLLDNLFN